MEGEEIKEPEDALIIKERKHCVSASEYEKKTPSIPHIFTLSSPFFRRAIVSFYPVS